MPESAMETEKKEQKAEDQVSGEQDPKMEAGAPQSAQQDPSSGDGSKSQENVTAKKAEDEEELPEVKTSDQIDQKEYFKSMTVETLMKIFDTIYELEEQGYGRSQMIEPIGTALTLGQMMYDGEDNAESYLSAYRKDLDSVYEFLKEVRRIAWEVKDVSSDSGKEIFVINNSGREAGYCFCSFMIGIMDFEIRFCGCRTSLIWDEPLSFFWKFHWDKRTRAASGWACSWPGAGKGKEVKYYNLARSQWCMLIYTQTHSM